MEPALRNRWALVDKQGSGSTENVGKIVPKYLTLDNVPWCHMFEHIGTVRYIYVIVVVGNNELCLLAIRANKVQLYAKRL